ncbi:MAG: acetyl-CoA carboxylase biotin carboxyl carrier protein subunit [Methanobacteriota archaeon]|nr:MAG: acetyl-CoA carboxylase biotin carboxyl carrier protein subunit [Euryarchaeota archaeon]
MHLIPIDDHRMVVHYGENKYIAHVASTDDTIYVHIDGEVFVLHRPSAGSGEHEASGDEYSSTQNAVEAPMPGKLLKVFVKEGQRVKRDDRLFIVEAMKMENEVRAPRDGVIHKINFKENDLVSIGEAIIEFADPDETQ